MFHWLNGLLAGNDGPQDVLEVFTEISVPLFGAAAVLLWLGDRPGGPFRWRLATTTALASAGLGLLVSQVIGHVWFRERPFTAHPGDTVLLIAPSPDPSFPSDHATAAFAIAFAILFVSRRAGAVFLAGAVAIALSRVFVGAHYPGDVLAGAGVGLVSAAAVTFLGRSAALAVTRLVTRATDPFVRPLRAGFDRVVAARRGLARAERD